MREISVTPITDRAQFLAEWTVLYSEQQNASFFQSPAWLKAWLETADSQLDLYKVASSNGSITELLGFFVVTPRRYAGLGQQEAWFQDSGNQALDAIYGEYVDFLGADDVLAAKRIAAINAMMKAAPQADSFVFRNVTAEMAEAVKNAADTFGWQTRILREQSVFVCELIGAAFEQNLSKSLLTKINRSIRLYEERGPIDCRVIKPGADFMQPWRTMTELHAQGWRDRGEKSVFENGTLNAFHERLRDAVPQDVHLFEARAGEQTIAVLYNFVHGDRVLNYQCGFLYENDNRLAPGFVAHYLAAQHYRQEGFRIYDLLAGDAEYKQRLGKQQSTLTSLVLEQPTWRNKIRKMLRH
ncbi:GNAT family N-acetyltransferase [Hyphococcus flavus]|uniref:GNAT family N-acetyltransferase n=1 Tax=Hyphococcus flavus TaxID=1866326 RepID=A0AAE9ZI67_9PROT|nr:GNAT family N-acetyltransferase [Hyphococcus flavus]WDI31371.1 GNAT family N-acetyltransferase [Hyphococcus flavus]